MVQQLQRVPDKALLESIALFFCRQSSFEGAPDMWFQVNENATGLEYHFSHEGQATVLDLPVVMEGEEIQVRLPSRRLVCFKKDVLDQTGPIWNN